MIQLGEFTLNMLDKSGLKQQIEHKSGGPYSHAVLATIGFKLGI